jgi:hypothetical protein
MDRVATVQSEESARDDEELVFNPADDSSSSYEASSVSENERQEVTRIQEDSSSARLRQLENRSIGKIKPITPAATSSDLPQPRIKKGPDIKTLYSDEWIKADAARWAASFTGPIDS